MCRHGGHGGGVASDRPPAPYSVRGLYPNPAAVTEASWRSSYRYIDNSRRGFVLPSKSSVILEPRAWAMLSYALASHAGDLLMSCMPASSHTHPH